MTIHGLNHIEQSSLPESSPLSTQTAVHSFSVYLGHTFDSCAELLAQFLALDYLYGAICAFKRMKSALDSSRKYKTKKALPPPSIWQLNKLVSCIFYYPQKSACGILFVLVILLLFLEYLAWNCTSWTNCLFLFFLYR